MRPAGEVRQALLDAAAALSTPERSPTLREMAQHAQVGFLAARRTVDHMKRSGVLVIVRTRKVDYRNRPVGEYSPPGRLQTLGVERVPLYPVFQTWSRPVI